MIAQHSFKWKWLLKLDSVATCTIICVGTLKAPPVIQIGCTTGSICSTLAHYEYKLLITQVVGI